MRRWAGTWREPSSSMVPPWLLLSGAERQHVVSERWSPLTAVCTPADIHRYSASTLKAHLLIPVSTGIWESEIQMRGWKCFSILLIRY